MLYYPSQAKPRPARLREKDRDPYDGLRPWSAITHGIGAALALLGTVLLLLRCAALSLSPWHVVSFLIYGVSMVGLYTASTLYHCRNVSVKGPHRPAQVRPRLYLLPHRRYLYPYLPGGAPHRRCLGLGPVRCHLGLGPGRAGAHPGLDHRPRWLTAGIYIFMGWLAVVALVPLLRLLPLPAFSGCWAAAFSTPWAACSTPSSGLAAIIPALAVTRFFTCSSLWARCFTSCSCTGWSRFSEHK